MNNMVEEWRVIPGYENYEVSNLGQIRSLNWKRTGTIRIGSVTKKCAKEIFVKNCKYLL